MKRCSILFIFSVCSFLQAAEPSTNRLSIHLLTDTAPPWNWDHAAKQPILSDSDFLAFDTTNHTFVITAEAAKRLVVALAGREVTFVSSGETFYLWEGVDTPFFLQACGKPIYVGVFYSPWSSRTYWDAPVVAPYGGDLRTGTNATFQIDLGPLSRQSASLLALPLYGGLSNDKVWEDYFRKTDIRNDRRTERAVKELFTHAKR